MSTEGLFHGYNGCTGYHGADTDPALGGIDRTDHDRTAQGKAEVV